MSSCALNTISSQKSLRFFNLAVFCLISLFLSRLKALHAANYDFPSDELSILNDLFVSTGGDNWKWRPSQLGAQWNFSGENVNPCRSRWQGIDCFGNCITSPCSLNTINLGAYGLVGTLPASLGRLNKLQSLTFSRNRLYGPIPEEFSNMTSLIALNLNANRLQGTIPPSLGNLSVIQEFYFHFNKFEGPLPESFGYLERLQFFVASFNKLTGTIPSSYANLQNLVTFYMDNNHLRGTIPAFVGSWSQLVRFYIQANNFTGTLPPELGQLKQLQLAYMYRNHLSGSIPEALGDATSLTTLELSACRLNGTLPASFANLSNLYALKLQGNFLSGTIPPSYGVLTSMNNIVLAENRLTGTIPEELCNWASVDSLYFTRNRLNGTIPACFGQLENLTELYVDHNQMTGTLHASFGSNAKMYLFYLNSNYFNGTIPPEYAGMTAVTNIYLDHNRLTGTIPSIFGGMSAMLNLALNDNQLNGTIPASIGQMDQLANLHLENNRLTGTLPEELSRLSLLKVVSFASNELRGNISLFESAATFSRLETLDLQNNQFDGVIPMFGNMPALIRFQLQNNRFSGEVQLNFSSIFSLDLSNNQLEGCFPFDQLPVSIGFLNLSSNQFACILADKATDTTSGLQSIDLSSNAFYGPVGSFFSNIENFTYVILSNNQISGNMDTMFNRALQSKLSIFAVANNRLSGTIPESLFTFPDLTAVILTSNCLEDKLPSNICEPRNLTSLVLDGLGSSLSCNKPLWFGGYRSFYTVDATNAIDIPSCLFSDLPSIETIHLSSMNLKGKIPSTKTLPLSLKYLSLSNNDLSGTVPSVFFEHPSWNEFDVSFNRLSGELGSLELNETLQTKNYAQSTSSAVEKIITFLTGDNSTVAPTSSAAVDVKMRLLVNRFSGSIPASYLDLADVDILNGNIFSCSSDHEEALNQLPENDQNSETYNCGSNTIDSSLYIWGGLVVVYVGLLLIFYRNVLKEWCHQFVQTFFDADWSAGPLYQNIPAEFRPVMRFNVCLTMFTIFVLVPFYVIMKIWFGTYAQQYAYTISSCFMTDVVPAVLLCFLIYFPLLGLYMYQGFLPLSSALTLQSNQNNIFISAVRDDSSLSKGSLEPYVNELRNGNASQSERNTPTTETPAAATSSLSNIGWFSLIFVNVIVVASVNGLYVYSLSHGIDSQYVFAITLALSGFKIASNMVLSHFLDTSESAIHALVALLIFNNIVIPYAAESFVNTNCFYYATVQPTPIVSASVPINTFALIINPKIRISELLLPNYYLITYAVTQNISFRPPFRYSFQCSSSLIVNFAGVFVLRYLISGLVRPLLMFSSDFILRHPKCRDIPLLVFVVEQLEQPRWKLIRALDNAVRLQTAGTAGDEFESAVNASGDDDEKAKPRRLEDIAKDAATDKNIFDHATVCASMVVDLAMMMTFGVSFPFLNLMICLSLFIDALDLQYFIYRLRVLQTAHPTQLASLYTSWVTHLGLVASWLKFPIPYMSLVIACFWAFTLFDTLGSSVGAVGAIWIVVVMCVSPLVWYCLLYYQVPVWLCSRVSHLLPTASTGIQHSDANNDLKTTVQNPLSM